MVCRERHWNRCHGSAIGVPLSCGTVPESSWDAGFHTLASMRLSWKLPESRNERNGKSVSDLMPTGTHLGESRSSQSSERSQSVLSPFGRWVRPGVGGAANSPTTRKGLCSIGIYEKPAAGGATGLLVDSDWLSKPTTGGGVTGSELFTSAEGIRRRFPFRTSCKYRLYYKCRLYHWLVSFAS